MGTTRRSRKLEKTRLELWLDAETIERLEQLRHVTPKGSLAAAVQQAIVGYLNQQRPVDVRALERLTPRLREVLQKIAEGRTTKEIAAELGISVKTVEMHRTQLMKTLHIHGIAGLVRFAIRTGIVPPGYE